MLLVATNATRVQITVQAIFFHNLNYKFEKKNLSKVHQLIDLISIELSKMVLLIKLKKSAVIQSTGNAIEFEFQAGDKSA